MRLTIRIMAEGDVPAAAALERLCFSEPWSEANLYAEMINPRGTFFVAELGGEMVGYTGLHHVMDEGYINNVAVAPVARQRGVGDALIDTLCGFALTQKLRFLTLEARQSNTPAIALYAKHGFKRVGLRRGFYSEPIEDAVLMTKYFKSEEEAV